MKASGPGGQNVNNVSTKIRLTHIPSGTIVVAQEERSQHRNKALALARLYEILSNQNQNKIEESKKDKWAQHSNLERGREIRTYNDLDFKRIIK
jgi:peptide chain release factor